MARGLDAEQLIIQSARRPRELVLQFILMAIVFSITVAMGGPIELLYLLTFFGVSNAIFTSVLLRQRGQVSVWLALGFEFSDSLVLHGMVWLLWTEPHPLIQTTALMLLAAVGINAMSHRCESALFRTIDQINLTIGSLICIGIAPEETGRDGGWLIFAAGLLATLAFFRAVLLRVAGLRQKEAQHRLIEVERIRTETIGRLTAGVSHDFNNLLTVIGGNIELAGQAETVEDRDAYLSEAREAARAGARVTAQLQSYARQAVLRPSDGDLAELLTRVGELVARTLPGHIDFSLVLDEPLPAVAIDHRQFETALLNLTMNAQEAMQNGGRLTVRAGARHAPLPVGDLPAGDHFVVQVLDTGSGIAPDLLPVVSEPYVTTKEAAHAAGLGLSMVNGFMLQSGGVLELHSSPNTGTSAEMWFPVAAGMADAT